MSLVNDMLCDLEARRASEARPLEGLAAVVNLREPAPARRGLLLGMLAIGALIAVLAIVAWPGESAAVRPALTATHSIAGASASQESTHETLPGDPSADRVSLRFARAAAASAPDTGTDPGVRLDRFSRYRLSYALASSPAARARSASRAAEPGAISRRRVTAVASANTPATATATAPVVASPEVSQPDLREEGVEQPQRVSKTRIDPARAWRAEGLRALRASRPAQAAELFEKLRSHDPHTTESHLLLHGALKAAERPIAARAVLYAGLEAAAEPARVAIVLAHELLAADDAAAAVRILRQYRPPGFADLGYESLLAAAYERSAAHTAALEQYRALLEADPGNGAWWVGAGIACEALGRGDEAITAFRRARATRLAPALAQYAEQRIASLEQGS